MVSLKFVAIKGLSASRLVLILPLQGQQSEDGN